MQTIEINDVGPVEHLSITTQPGVTLVKGPNDEGKSIIVEAIKILLGGKSDAEVTCRDSTISGSVEGLGAKVTFKRSARRSGDLEARTLEDRFSIADLVDPKLTSPDAADKRRIRALLQLTGVTANAEAFRDLFPDGDSFNAACTADVLKCDDIVEMAAKIRRNIHEAARKAEGAAEKAEGQALGCKQAADGVDMAAEADADILQATLEDAIARRGKLFGEASMAREVQARAAEARSKIEHSESPDVAGAENRRNEAQVARNEAEAEVDRLEKELASARSVLQDAKAAFAEADHSLSREKSHADTWGWWQDSVAAAEGVSVPAEGAIKDAEQAVTDARAAIEKAAVVRAAKEKATEAESYRKLARDYRTKAEQLREAAKGTDDVLSRMVASDNLIVKAGRLITQHPERGEVFYSARSTGTRWMIAIDEAVKRVVQLDTERLPVVLVPQECWGELDPTNRRIVHAHAIERGVMVLGIEATDGGLRAEPYKG